MNYLQLKTRIASSASESYSHRADITGSLLDDLIDNARERIGTDLRNRSVLTRGAVTLTSGVGTLPTGFQKMRQVLDAEGNPLRSFSAQEYARWNRNSGAVVGYYVADQLYVAPPNSGSYTAQYYATPPAFTDDADTVIEPSLFIYASMLELSIFTDDQGRIQSYQQLYDNRVKELNVAHRFEQRAVGRSEYDYSTRNIGL